MTDKELPGSNDVADFAAPTALHSGQYSRVKPGWFARMTRRRDNLTVIGQISGASFFSGGAVVRFKWLKFDILGQLSPLEDADLGVQMEGSLIESEDLSGGALRLRVPSESKSEYSATDFFPPTHKEVRAWS